MVHESENHITHLQGPCLPTRGEYLFIEGTDDFVEYRLQRNCLHRDLKCENVLLDENGTAKVADFGLSRILAESYIRHARQLQVAKEQALSSQLIG